MSSFADSSIASYDGVDVARLAESLGIPRVVAFDSVRSTMDVAHALASQGEASGTLIIADAQQAGRGREGRAWSSRPGHGLWLTLVERPNDPRAIEVLSLRLGLRAAAAVEGFAPGDVRLKWPNDLYVGAKKLAGVLVEARWRDGRPEWVAMGVGMNVRAPGEVPTATGLRDGVDRLDVLRALVPALRAAAACGGLLSGQELDQFAARDLARGRRVVAPVAGVVRGITEKGELAIETDAGGTTTVGYGSLVFAD